MLIRKKRWKIENKRAFFMCKIVEFAVFIVDLLIFSYIYFIIILNSGIRINIL